jgi:sortase A
MSIRPSRELIALVAGAILVLGGIVGAIIVFGGGERDTSKEEYFASQTAISATSDAATATAAALPSPNVTPTATVPGVVQGMNIDPNAYLVHVDPSTGLESPNIPDRIVIPAVKIDAPVVVADFNYTDVEGETFGQWMAPSQYAAGWHPNSALLGQVGNTVINGHHNEYGEVFKDIVNLEIGDEIYVYSKGKKFTYVVANEPMKLLELYQNVETRLNNARWLAKTDDERLTLVTCWPPLSNTYRVIVVARPSGTGE